MKKASAAAVDFKALGARILYAFFDAQGAAAREPLSCRSSGRSTAARTVSLCSGLPPRPTSSTSAERRQIMEWTGRGCWPAACRWRSRSPNRVVARAGRVRARGEDAGADWVILQPPPSPGFAGAEFCASSALWRTTPTAGRDPERRAISRVGLVERRRFDAEPQPPERLPAEGRGAGARIAQLDRTPTAPTRVQRPRRAGAARLLARRLRRHDPGAGMLRRAGRGLRGHARAATARRRAALPRLLPLIVVHDELDRDVHVLACQVNLCRRARHRPIVDCAPCRTAPLIGRQPAQAFVGSTTSRWLQASVTPERPPSREPERRLHRRSICAPADTIVDRRRATSTNSPWWPGLLPDRGDADRVRSVHTQHRAGRQSRAQIGQRLAVTDKRDRRRPARDCRRPRGGRSKRSAR